MSRFYSHYFDRLIDSLIPRHLQIKLARHVLLRARGEGNCDPLSNGEYDLIRALCLNYFQNQPQVTIFDVGANIGNWSTYVSQLAQSNWQFYCFEPSLETFQTLSRNINQKNLNRLCISENLGLSDTVSEACLHITAPLGGTNSLYSEHIKSLQWPLQATETIQLDTGDAICQRHQIERIGFLKIDTEGHELMVLRGFQQMLTSQAIDCIQFEYGYCWIDSRSYLKDAWDLLHNNGYSIGKIHPRGVEWIQQYSHLLESYSFANFTAVLPHISSYINLVS